MSFAMFAIHCDTNWNVKSEFKRHHSIFGKQSEKNVKQYIN